jgi:hypothetical protein
MSSGSDSTKMAMPSLHKHIDQLSPAQKLRLNLNAGREIASLNRKEMRQIRREILPRTFWIPPCAVKHIYLPVPNVKEVVTFSDLQAHVVPIRQQITFNFIHQIIAQRRPYQETDLFQFWKSGATLYRYTNKIGEIKEGTALTSESDFERYYQRCLDLAASMSTHGVLDVSGNVQVGVGEKDKNCTIAIDDFGQLVHFTLGKHRLAIAQELGLEQMPVSVRFVSAKYLVTQQPRWKLAVATNLTALIRSMVEAAVLRACEECGREVSQRRISPAS